MTINCGFSNGIMYARNVDFTGELNVAPTVVEDGQLLIGSSTDPSIRVGHLTSSDSSVTITEGPGTIDLSVGEFGTLTFDADTGSASPIANTLNVAGSHGLNTDGATDTLTFAIDNAITLGDLTNLGASDALTVETGSISLLAGNLQLPAYAGMDSVGRISFWNTEDAVYTPSIWTDNSNWFCGFSSNSSGSAFSPSCTGNTTLGTQTLQYLGSVDVGDYNTAVGFKSLYVLGENGGNTGLGANTLYLLESGSGNLAAGNLAGSALTGSESDNIYLSNVGVVGDNNTIRVGNSTDHNRAFIAGVATVQVANQVLVSMNPSNGQLGNLTLTSSDESITIDTSSPGTIDLTTSGGSGGDIPFTDKASNFTASSKNGYFVSGNITATFPASPSQGDLIVIVCDVDAPSFATIQLPSGQFLRVGKSKTTSGGQAVNTAIGNALTLYFRSSTSTWIATDVQGTWILN